MTSCRTGPGCFDLTRHVLLTDSNNFPIAAFSVCQLCSASQFHTLVRQAEFGRACLKTFLENSSTPFHYLGLVREKNHADLRAAFESEIYKHWDEDATLSPPKTRPPSTASQPSQQQLGLELLAMENGAPVFPSQVLLSKFKEGSPEQEEVKKMEKTFHEKYAPPTQSRRNSTSGQQGHRASGQCDFSIDNGQRPIDVSREVDLPTVPVSEVPAERCSFQDVPSWGGLVSGNVIL